ncbi:MAG: ABC transporter substrate-binding protein [Elusimicrobia bacterium]|nr:ABC transporter substrate-binding protein [Elusimicrobiota bacterium]
MKIIMRLIPLAVLFLFKLSAIAAAPGPYPQRIISLGPFLTEEIYLLHLDNRLVANTIYCQKPAAAQKKEKVGTVMEVNLEKIVSLKPDLVLTTALTNPKAKDKLNKLGLRVEDFPAAASFTEILEQFIRLGRLTGQQKKAEEIIEQVKTKVVSMRNKIENVPKPTVLMQIGANPLWVATKNSFLNDLIECAGGINIGPSSTSGLYSREKVLAQDPEIIIIATMGIAGENEREIWNKYQTVKAVKNKRIHIIDSYKLCSPTPVSFVDVLEEIVKIIHPGKVEILNEK